MENRIKVGFCVAYDWSLLEHALPLIYRAADLICLSLDSNRVSWSGNPFAFDEFAFRRLLAEIDTGNKIEVYEDNFYKADFTPMQNEVRQRNLMANFMKPGGWHIQLDCDEYFANFDEFVEYLVSLPKKNYRFNVCCSWITLFKRIDEGFLCVVPDSVQGLEYVQIATRSPAYEYGRRNGDFNYLTNFRIIHQSWARSESEIALKIANWGHVYDFDKNKFLQMWRSLDYSNFQSFSHIHPIQPKLWPALSILRGESIGGILADPLLKKIPSYSSFRLVLKNSRFLSRVRAIWLKVA